MCVCVYVCVCVCVCVYMCILAYKITLFFLNFFQLFFSDGKFIPSHLYYL